MLAISLAQVKVIGAALAALFVIGSIGSALLIKKVVQKVIFSLLLLALAGVVWTQRTAVVDCIDQARAGALQADTQCRFMGIDVSVPTGVRS